MSWRVTFVIYICNKTRNKVQKQRQGENPWQRSFLSRVQAPYTIIEQWPSMQLRQVLLMKCICVCNACLWIIIEETAALHVRRPHMLPQMQVLSLTKLSVNCFKLRFSTFVSFALSFKSLIFLEENERKIGHANEEILFREAIVCILILVKVKISLNYYYSEFTCNRFMSCWWRNFFYVTKVTRIRMQILL